MEGIIDPHYLPLVLYTLLEYSAYYSFTYRINYSYLSLMTFIRHTRLNEATEKPLTSRTAPCSYLDLAHKITQLKWCE
jgi:hypothetical protein